MGVVEIVLIVVGCVLGAAAILYGLLRKGSRTSWIGWQVMALFALTFILDAIGKPQTTADEKLYFSLTLCCFFVALVAVIGLEWLLRHIVLNRPKPGKGVVWLSRIFGAVCTLMNLAVFALVLGGLAFGIIAALPVHIAELDGFYANGFWTDFLAGHFYDLFLVALCFVFVRAGLRLGVIRGIYYLLMIALTFGALLSAYLLVTHVPFFASWGEGLAGHFTSLTPAGASALGYGIIVILFFIVFFAIIMGIGALLHWGLRNLISIRAVGLTSALLLAVIFYAVFFAGMCAFYYGIAYLEEFLAGWDSGISTTLQPIVEGAETFLTASPFSAAFFRYNPLLWFLKL